jgi:hypothetical protein
VQRRQSALNASATGLTAFPARAPFRVAPSGVFVVKAIVLGARGKACRRIYKTSPHYFYQLSRNLTGSPQCMNALLWRVALAAIVSFAQEGVEDVAQLVSAWAGMAASTKLEHTRSAMMM